MTYETKRLFLNLPLALNLALALTLAVDVD